MTDPWKGVNERHKAQKELMQQTLDNFAMSFDRRDYCANLSVCSHSSSVFEPLGVYCTQLSKETLTPDFARSNCHKDCSTCPNYTVYKEPEVRHEPELYEDNEDDSGFDIDELHDRLRAIEELHEMSQEQLHELYDVAFEDLCSWECRKEQYQLSILARHKIAHKMNLITNVLKHINERAEKLEYITYKEMEN